MANKALAKFNSRRLALTLARRSMKRNLLQSILIILIIAMPVAFGSAALIYNESTQMTVQERIDIELGKTQAVLRASSVPNEMNCQTPDSEFAFYCDYSNSSGPEQLPLVDPRSKLSGYKWLTEYTTDARVKTASGVGVIFVTEGESWAPEFAGRYYDMTGQAPQSSDELMVNKVALQRLGAKVGDEVWLTEFYRPFTIVGTLESSQLSKTTSMIFALPGAISGTAPNPDGYIFYAVGDKPITWSQIVELNKSGIGVLSREVLLNPPANKDVPYYEYGGMPDISVAFMSYLPMVFIAPLVLLPVAVLAGSAFSFGARRQARSLAVMSSLGANRWLLRFVTVANGIWLGLLGGILGVLLGAAGAAWLLPTLTDGSRIGYPGFHLPWELLSIAALSGAVIGALVSLKPAFSAAKVDVLSTLRGVRINAQVRKRSGIGGLIVLAIGVAVSFLSLIGVQAIFAGIQNHTIGLEAYNYLGWLVFAIIIGSGLMILGLLIAAGWLLVLARLIFKNFGKVTNYATNDLIYHRKRYTSVIAAVLATSFIGAAAMSLSFSFSEQSRLNYQQRAEMNQLTVDTVDTFGYAENRDSSQLDSLLADNKNYIELEVKNSSQVADIKSSAVIGMHAQYYELNFGLDKDYAPIIGAEGEQPYLKINFDYLCPWMTSNPVFKKYQAAQDAGDYQLLREIQAQPKYKNCMAVHSPEKFLVGGPNELRALLGDRVDSQAEAALAAGKAVVFHPGFLHSGSIEFDWYQSGMSMQLIGESYTYNESNEPIIEDPGPPSRTEAIAAVSVSSANPNLTAMISPETADRLGIDYRSSLGVVNYERKLTVAERDALTSEMNMSYYLEQGFDFDVNVVIWWITAAVAFFVLVSTTIALGLSQIESKSDRSTLSSIGAPRRFRAAVVGNQALILTLFGTVLGTAVGLFLAWATTEALGIASVAIGFKFPLIQTALMVFAIPLVAAAIFWVGTPAKSNYRPRLSLD